MSAVDAVIIDEPLDEIDTANVTLDIRAPVTGRSKQVPRSGPLAGSDFAAAI